MSSSTKPTWSAILALAVIGAAVGGSTVRFSIESGISASPRRVPSGPLLASTGHVPELGEGEFFFSLMDQLSRTYVDPIEDEEKLAVGAVKGMVGRLADSFSVFMDAEEMKRHEAMLRGEFEGIGVETKYLFSEESEEVTPDDSQPMDLADLVPELVVTAVAPGGPADRAGMRPGDVIETVAGRWVLSPTSIREFRKLGEQIQRGQVDEGRLQDLRLRMREQSRNGMAPARAREELTKGTDGDVKVTWRRGARQGSATLTRGTTQVPSVREGESGVLEVRAFRGATAALRDALRGRSSATLDLRNGTQGDYGELESLLSTLAPAGVYGQKTTERGRPAKPLRITDGAPEARKLTLLVDRSTRGVAEVLALALSAHGKATLRGGPTSGERVILETVRLQDGSGYTIPIARFQPQAPSAGGQS